MIARFVLACRDAVELFGHFSRQGDALPSLREAPGTISF